ncbi:3936_t:CDS:2 [Gigaspora margarita]|uniref:50S ribosomal protein L35 n=1 Tax=Gigaspora margarita TaxID=4874 RepID=A0ABN7VF89_GIGMA|nr:3936_t:CDS:2 [Gigaspora margarita]
MVKKIKLRSKSSILKRFKKSANGHNLRHWHAYTSHLAYSKTTKQRRHLQKNNWLLAPKRFLIFKSPSNSSSSPAERNVLTIRLEEAQTKIKELEIEKDHAKNMDKWYKGQLDNQKEEKFKELGNKILELE